MAGFAHYRRVVVEMREPAPEPALRLAAELAHLLDVELEGVFVENEALLHLASLPFAREFRLPGHTWQALDARRMLADFRLAADRAERLLNAAARGSGVASAFSVLRADSSAALDAHPDDILVVVEPEAHRPDWPLGRARGPNSTAAGILLAPAHGVARRGPIAVAARPGVGLAIAHAIAVRAGESLLLLTTSVGPNPDIGSDFPQAHVQRCLVPALTPAEFARAASRWHARLLVLEEMAAVRPEVQRFLVRFVEQSGIPVLLLGEPRAEPSVKVGGKLSE